MKIAHLLLTHKAPAQLERLLDALDHPAFDFYIHLDGKTDAAPFQHLLQRPNLRFIRERAKIHWAGWGTIQATLNGFAEIPLEQYGYINVISGQDFPIKPAEEIYRYLVEHRGSEFMTCETVGGEWPEAEVRMTRYHFINWKLPGKYRLEAVANRILPRRKFPFDFTIVGRANWFTVTPAAARYMQDFIRRHPALTRFFKLSWGADEIIFSTVLYNSPFREAIVPNLVYVDWRGQTEGHPKILGKEDLEALQASDKLFARKFDMEKDEELFRLIEQTLLQKQNSKVKIQS